MSRILSAVTALLLALPLHAALDLAEPRLGPSDRVWTSTVAAGKDGFLSVWHHGIQSDLAVTTIDAAGKTESASGVAVPLFDLQPAAAYSVLGALTDGYLLQVLSWSGAEPRAHFLRLAADGTTRGPWNANLPLDRYILGATNARGDRVLLLPIESSDAEGRMVDAEGTLIGTVPLPMTRDWRARYTIAAGDEDFVFAWWDDASLYVQRVDAADASVGPAITVATSERWNGLLPFVHASAALSGPEILVVYAVRQQDVQRAMNAARIDGEGRVTHLDPLNGLTEWIGPDASPAPFTLKRASDHYVLVGWDFPRSTLSAMRVSSEGATLDAAPVDVQVPRASGAHVANRGDRFYITSLDQFGSQQGIVGGTFVTTGGIHDVRQELLSITPSDQTRPRVATDGAVALAVWDEHVLADSHLRGTLFRPGGESVAPVELLLARRSSVHEVAYAAGVFAVIWRDTSVPATIYATRSTASGAVLDAQPIRVTPPGADVGAIALAASNTGFLAVWSTSNGRLFAATLATDGTVGEAHLLPAGPEPAPGAARRLQEFSVGSDGDRFLVLSTVVDQRGGDPFLSIEAHAESLIVSADGVATTMRALRVADGSSGPVAWNGDGYVYVAPTEDRTAVLGRIDRKGALVGSLQKLDLPGLLNILDVTVSRGDVIVGYEADAPAGAPIRRVARVGSSTQRFSLRGAYLPEWRPSLRFVNVAGELLAVADDLHAGLRGARSFHAVVYREAELVPVAGRRAAARR